MHPSVGGLVVAGWTGHHRRVVLSPRMTVTPAVAQDRPLAFRASTLLERGRRILRDGLLAPLYRLYAARLFAEVMAGPMPRHLGIILDGNRRYGRAHGLTDFRRIYDLGASRLDDVLDWCGELRIPAVTLWVCSTDNLSRPALEVSGILHALEEKMRALGADPRIHRLGVRVETIGRLELLPDSVVAALDAARRATAANDRMVLTIAVGYGGREEIADAVRSLLQSCAANDLSLRDAVAQVTPEAIRRHLYTASLPDPDLIIRTSGEARMSGFLLWQSVYSEFYFTDVNWPAFRRIDLLRAIRAFQARDRRFGQ